MPDVVAEHHCRSVVQAAGAVIALSLVVSTVIRVFVAVFVKQYAAHLSRRPQILIVVDENGIEKIEDVIIKAPPGP